MTLWRRVGDGGGVGAQGAFMSGAKNVRIWRFTKTKGSSSSYVLPTRWLRRGRAPLRGRRAGGWPGRRWRRRGGAGMGRAGEGEGGGPIFVGEQVIE